MAKKRRKKQPVKKQPNRLRLLFVILGPLLIAHSVYWYWGNQIKANFIAHESNTSVTYENAPVSITIQSSDTPISVIPGGIYDGQWLLSDSQALYLPSSGKLGEGYNTVLYAHNTPALFGPLKKTSIGDRVTLTSGQGSVFIFEITEKRIVNARNLKALYSQTPNTLTLFTCSGWADRTRLIVKAKRIYPQ